MNLRERRAYGLLFGVPLAAVVLFAARFATALPLTDEWFYTRAAMAMDAIDFLAPGGLTDAVSAFPTWHYDHIVSLPFLIYWPFGECIGFDARFFVGASIVLVLAEVLLLRRFMIRSWLWTFPLALLLLNPARYVEWIWGWMYTVVLSLALPLAGLCALSTLPGLAKGHLRRCVLAIALILAGLLCSAGAFFAFPAAVACVLLQPLPRPAKLRVAAALIVTGVVAFALLTHHEAIHRLAGMRDVWFVLTALGAAVLSSPLGLLRFGFDARSALGGIALLALVAAVAIAVRRRALSEIAAPLAVALFGLLSLVPIALARDYLANYHLHYAAVALSGAYATAYVLWRRHPSPASVSVFGLLCAVVGASLSGAFTGATREGPAYGAYARAVGRYAHDRLEHPQLLPPYPVGESLDTELILFLSAEQNAVFRDGLAAKGANSAKGAKPLDPRARILLAGAQRRLPLQIDREAIPGVSPLIVVLPKSTATHHLLARIGEWPLVLRRLSPVGAVAPCADPALACFGGVVLGRKLARGPQPVRFEVP
ncbi:MAG TPA: hypothetical protein VGH20_22485 [Myxococcales bacterium]